MTRTLNLTLITLGDPTKVTGGYLYQQRLAALASTHNAKMAFVSFPERPFPLPLGAYTRVLAEVIRLSPQVLIVDSIIAGYLAPAILRQTLPFPVCGLLHQPPGGIDHGPLRSRMQGLLDMIVYRNAAKLIVASDSLFAEMTDRGIAPSSLIVVPPGRDIGEPTTASLTPLDLRRGRTASFLCVSNWQERKGIHTLLEAFAKIPREAATLHLVGDNSADPSYSRRLFKRIAQTDLLGRVFVHGVLTPEQVAGFYQRSDAFVLPSYKEPYGTVYGEAMTAGLPVVGFQGGNLPNLVTHGVEGLIAPLGDSAALAQCLMTLAQNRELREEMGKAAKKRASSFPSWEESATLFFATLRNLAGA